MVSIAFIKNERTQISYHIKYIFIKNYKECFLCKTKINEIYVLEIWKNSEPAEYYAYCRKCFEFQFKFLKQDIYNTYWNTLIFLINNYGFTIERTNLIRERCDFCYTLYTRFKVKLYPILFENRLCVKCFKNKLEKIILDFERNIFVI